mmetsp:Transcript_62710/g.70192  ORF Transcript_62710/g.70192 Transcript_62710/m.70192 type:complete len:226 (+) Transcript_62710:300-977(+)
MNAFVRLKRPVHRATMSSCIRRCSINPYIRCIHPGHMAVPPEKPFALTLGNVNILVPVMWEVPCSFPVVMWINTGVVRRQDSLGVLPRRRVKCMVIVCIRSSIIPSVVIVINMVVSDRLAIHGVTHSRNASVRLIRSVQSTIAVVIVINMVVLDRLAIRGVTHSRNVFVRLIRSVHLSLHRSILMFRVVMWINTVAVLRQATRIVPPVIPVNVTMIVVSINPMVI